METVVGLNLTHHDTCLFTKSVGGEGLFELNKFICDTLNDAVHLVALRLEDRRLSRYQNLQKGADCLRGISIRNDERLLSHDERTSAPRWA